MAVTFMNDRNGLEEEVFCLKYELETLSNVLLRNESERWVPGYLYPRTEYSHIERYKLACNYSVGKKVIDIACGIGKGSHIMATEGKAAKVDGFDIQSDAIRYASWRYTNDNLRFAINNAEALNIANEYDLAVSFETVEHLPNYRNFFSSIKDCLKPEGLFLISTPISPLPLDVKPANPYHVQEWGFKEFHKILEELFTIEKVFVQLYPEIRRSDASSRKSLLSRVYNRIEKKISAQAKSSETGDLNNINDTGFSKIDEFSEQFNINELGNTRIGYQLVLVKKKP